MFKKYPFLIRFGVFVFLPVVIMFVTTYIYLEKSSPKYKGTFKLTGLDNPVTITFDQFGSPNVIASSDKDAYFTQGYLHASERIWQMELQRRLVQGRLSEIFGASSVSTDIFMRTLGLDDAAENAWNNIGKEAQSALIAYAQGVNAWLDNVSVLPPEFLFFGITPDAWKATDPLAWQKVFAMNLGQNMYEEISRMSALKLISPKQLKTFFQYDPDFEHFMLEKVISKTNTLIISKQSVQASVDPQIPDGSEQVYQFKNWLEMDQDLEQKWFLGERFAGSNAWVVSGQHTRSGVPILANDPHLSLQQPSVWYAMQMKGDELDVSGMSMVGIPGVILGRNRNIAWGATSLMSDQQDLFILDVPLDDNHTYLTDKGRKSIEISEETINIRPEIPVFLNKKIKPITVQIRRTELGPIISDVVQSPGYLMALSWVALDVDDRSFESFYKLQYAKDWQEFRSAMQLLKAPGLHFLFADKDGNIGSQVAGHIPLRGNNVGVLPQKAFDSVNFWKDYVLFEQLPSQFNPKSGVIVSANNRIESLEDVVISHEWASFVRNNRISQLLDELISNGKKLTIEDMVMIQGDQVDLGAKKLLPLLQQEKIKKLIIEGAPPDLVEMSNKALVEVSGWDADYNIDSAGASVYRYWFEELKSEVFSDDFYSGWSGSNGSDVSGALIRAVTEEQMTQILAGKESEWCERLNKDIYPCQKEIVDSFYSAIKLIKKHTRSSQVEDWVWGKLHHVEYSHNPFGQIKLLDKYFKRELAVGGSENTINIAGSAIRPSGGYRQTLGASFRQVFDLGESNGDTYILPTGQSGSFLSVHYENMMEDFVKGDIKHFANYRNGKSPLLLNQSANRYPGLNKESTMTLTPARK